MSIPIIRLGDGMFIVGPFLASFTDGRIHSYGWPEWIRKVFPPGVVMFGSALWRPLRYASRADGGMWVVHGSYGWNDVRLMIIGGDGGLRGVVDLPLEHAGELRRWPVLAHGEWAVMRELILNGDRVFGKIDDSWPISLIPHGRVCMGEDGSLLFPGGVAVRPDGSPRVVFRKKHLVNQISDGAGIDGRLTELRQFGALAWEGDTVWVFAEHAAREPDVESITTVSRFRIRKRGDPVLEEVDIRETCRFAVPVPLADGGWFVRVSFPAAGNGGEGRHEELWAFRLPGSDNVRAVRIHITGSFITDMPQIAFHPEDGVFTILDIRDEQGKGKTLLGWADGRRFRTLRLVEREYRRFAECLDPGWVSIPGEDGKAGVLLFTEHVIRGLPGRLITPNDLARRIPDSVRGDGKFHLDRMFFVRDVVVVQGRRVWSQRGFFFATFRMTGGRPILVHAISVPCSPGELADFQTGDELNAIFSTFGGGNVFLQVTPDGSMCASMIS